MARPSDAVASKRVPALDAVRGIAIALVLLRHAWPTTFGAGGFVGVELFFVLSGYLITSILLGDVARGVVSYGRFYMNRFLRLVPALVAVTAVALVVAATVNPLSDRSHLLSGGITALTYTSDIPSWPLTQLTELGHLWTLAIEEQFYILWPVLLVTFALRGRQLRKMMWAMLAAGVVALVATVVVGEHHHSGIITIYTWPTTWAVTLLLGCAFAVGVIPITLDRRVSTVLCIALIGSAFLPEAKGHAWGYIVLVPIVAVLGVCLVSSAISASPVVLLNSRALQFLGKISYAAYLWNYPLSQWFSSVPAIILTIAAASASFVLVEQPFLRLKRRPPRQPAARDERIATRRGIQPASS